MTIRGVLPHKSPLSTDQKPLSPPPFNACLPLLGLHKLRRFHCLSSLSNASFKLILSRRTDKVCLVDSSRATEVRLAWMFAIRRPALGGGSGRRPPKGFPLPSLVQGQPTPTPVFFRPLLLCIHFPDRSLDSLDSFLEIDSKELSVT